MEQSHHQVRARLRAGRVRVRVRVMVRLGLVLGLGPKEGGCAPSPTHAYKAGPSGTEFNEGERDLCREREPAL